ncbi:MAG TPA: DUF1015 family protein [Nocardioides sp.]|nr:DUF1015 family protein [Nocardioides sp.]
MESGVPTVPPYLAGPLLLSPFRAYSLAPSRVGDPASARVFARPYRGVSQRLETWLKRGLAGRDDEPSLYLHEYSDSGLTVRGLVGCLELTHTAVSPGERQVFPHEDVHPKQVAELATRMGAMRINPAPILLVHRGPASIREVSRKVRTETPEQEYVDHAGQQHRVWAIRHPHQQEEIRAGLADARLLVADGHHRYAAYVALYEREPTLSHRSGLAMVIDQDETPLFLGAIHRLLHGVKLADLLAAAASRGADVRVSNESEALAALAPDTLALTDGGRWATISIDLPAGKAMIQLVDDLLHTGLPRRPTKLGFAHSVAQALEQVKPGRVTAALLPAVDLDLVMDVVRAGGLLPEKATSFQPKPSLGAFIRLLDE